MYHPILKQVNKENPKIAIEDLENNILCIHDELGRVISDLFERMDEWEEKHDNT
ncbi:MAG: hypothetical protein II359_00440 [Clostridia bacterium]|nr:hypothetical protein [Clostridia bacterium]